MWSRVSCLCLKSAVFGGLYLFQLADGGEHSCLSLREAKAHSEAVWSVSLQRSACHSIITCLADKGCLMKAWLQGGPVTSLTLVKCCLLPKEPVVRQESVSTSPECLPYDETGVG